MIYAIFALEASFPTTLCTMILALQKLIFKTNTHGAQINIIWKMFTKNDSNSLFFCLGLFLLHRCSHHGRVWSCFFDIKRG